MNAQKTIVVFRCAPLRNAELTRSSCAARWESLNHGKGAKRTSSSGPAVMGRECIGCLVGRAHADGDRPETWPDGSRIEFVDKALPAMPSPVALRKMPRPARHDREEVAAPLHRVDAPPAPEERPEAPPTVADAPVPVKRKIDFDFDLGCGEEEIPTGGNPSELGRVAHALARPVVTDGDVGPAHVEPMRGRVVVVGGVARTVEEWARHHGITTAAIYERVRRSWPLELAVSAPRGTTYEHATPPKRMRGDSSPRVRTRGFESQLVTHDGRTQDVLAWSHEVGISIAAVRLRVQRGESLESACTTPNRVVRPPVPMERNVDADAEVVARKRTAIDEPIDAASPMASPIVALLEAAGYEIAAASRAPAGLVVVVRELR